MMSLPAVSLGNRFCVSTKGGTGGGGWVHLKGKNSMTVSGFCFKQMNGFQFQCSRLTLQLEQDSMPDQMFVNE